MDAGQYGDDTTRCSSCGHQPGCECSCCAECDDAAALAAETFAYIAASSPEPAAF